MVVRPLEERRRLLEELLDPAVEAVRLSPAFDDGAALLEAARAQGLEGVVAKRADAPYRPGRRTPEWQKLKLRAEDDFPIVGYTRGSGRRAKLGALVLGRRRRTGSTGRGTSGPGSATTRWTGSCAAPPAGARDVAARETPKMPRIRAADITWVEPRSRPR